MVKQEKQIELEIDSEMFNQTYLPNLFDYSHRYNVFYGGRSSGKSAYISQKLIIKALNDKRRMLVLIKQTNRVNETVWRLFIDTLESFQILDKIKLNKSEHTMEFPNGSWIKFSGQDSSEKAKGFVSIDTVFFEETSDFNEEDLESIDGTLRGKAKNKEIYYAFNPVSKNNIVYKRWFAEGVNLEDTFILKTTYRDNKWCDPKEIERLERLKERNPARYAIEGLGNFHSLSKTIFTNWKVEKLNPEELLRNNPNLITLNAIDFGFNHPMACILSLYDSKNKILYVIDEIWKRGLTNADIARLVKEKGWHKNVIIADCAEPKSIKELKELGLKIKPCKKGAGSILSGIKRMQDLDIKINESCENTINEFENYVWAKNKNGEYLEEPEYGNDDCIDSIRYSLQGAKRPPKIIYTKFF